MRLFVILLSTTLFACTNSINKKKEGEYFINKSPSSNYKRKLHSELIFISGSQGMFYSWSNHMLFDHRTFTVAKIGNDSLVFNYYTQGILNDTILVQNGIITTKNPETFVFNKFARVSTSKIKRIAPSYILDTLGIE